MSPEQALGQLDEIGAPSDIYGLGAILYELLTGQPPFRCETMTETVNMVLRDTPVPPHRLAPDAPPDLERICLQCLEKDPALRYASAGALGEDLDRFLSGRAIVARSRGKWSRWLRRCRRRPLRTLAYVGAATFIVAGSLSLLGWSPGEKPAASGTPNVETAQPEPHAEAPPLNETERLLLRVRHDPTLPESARLLADLGDEKLMQIIQQNPNDFAVIFAAGDAYLLHFKRPGNALPLYKDAQRIAQEQTRAVDGGSENWNNLAWAIERLGDVQQVMKDRAGAQGAYNDAIPIRENLWQVGKGRQQGLDLARICGKQAELYIEENDNRTAYLLYAQRLDLLGQHLKQAPELAPDIRHAHQRLAHISRLLGDTGGAAFHDKAAAATELKLP
jgi:tetratricopeptide (TPR) repeat protein